MALKLTIANNYQAAAINGVGGFDDFIEVDVVPAGPTVARGNINIPITVTWEDGGLQQTLETICTGWTDTPSPRLFIDVMYNGGTSGQAATVICAPNRQVMELLQSAQSISTSVGAAETYYAEHGLMHYLGINGGCTISVEEGSISSPFSSGYEQVFKGGHITRFVLQDIGAAQPALTWNTWSAYAINWEAGAPQFVAGKTFMTVEIWGAGFALYGSYKLFD